MRRRTGLLLTLLAATLTMAAAVSTASAHRLEISEQSFLVLFRSLTIEGGAGLIVACDVNLEGSFHSRTVSKVSGALIGYVTEAGIHHPCVGGEVFTLNGVEQVEGMTLGNTLPWHVTYLSFQGTLPRIHGIELALRGVTLRITVLGVACLWESTAQSPMRGSAVVEDETGFPAQHPRGQITGLRINETSSIPKKEGSLLCPESLLIKGTGTVGTQREWRLIFVRLVT